MSLFCINFVENEVVYSSKNVYLSRANSCKAIVYGLAKIVLHFEPPVSVEQ